VPTALADLGQELLLPTPASFSLPMHGLDSLPVLSFENLHFGRSFCLQTC